MKTSYYVALAAALVATSASAADSVERPAVKEGDKWTYSVQLEETKNNMLVSSTHKYDLSVTRVTSRSLIVASKATDSNLPPNEQMVNLDWSVPRNVAGKDLIAAQPYTFPLAVGKKWDHEFTEPNPTTAITLRKNTWHYAVLGWEEVTVPAGKYKALKVEAEGNWYRENAPVGASARGAIVNLPGTTTAAVTSQQAYTPPPAGGR
jgi:hypothetical protein